MKEWIIDIEVVSTAYEAAYAIVEAETLEEALDLFEKDPCNYDWDGWETIDSETNNFRVNKDHSRERYADAKV
tara:strand:- start:354 stop:572 length:219 start_codon:yes stop_codon:yes gene_type:complete